MIKTILILSSVIALILSGFLLSNPAHFMYQLVVREKPIHADAIVILLGGAANERVELAVNLYEQHYATQIVLCDGYMISGLKAWWYNKSGLIPLGKSFRYQLRNRGVPEAAINLAYCPGIHDTASEVLALNSYLKNKGLNQVLISTSASHSRRASIVWKRVAPSIPATMIAARDPGLQRWWTTRRGRTTLIYEYLALAKELFRHHSGY